MADEKVPTAYERMEKALHRMTVTAYNEDHKLSDVQIREIIKDFTPDLQALATAAQAEQTKRLADLLERSLNGEPFHFAGMRGYSG